MSVDVVVILTVWAVVVAGLWWAMGHEGVG